MRPRISIRGFVRPSIRPSVRRLVTRFFTSQKWGKMVQNDFPYLCRLPLSTFCSHSVCQSVCLSISLSQSFFRNLSFAIFLLQSFFCNLSIAVFLLQSFFCNEKNHGFYANNTFVKKKGMLNKKYKLARFKMKMMGFVRIVHLSKEKKRGVKQIVQLCNKVINV